MATKDITDKQVVEAYQEYQKSVAEEGYLKYPYEILRDITGEPEKVCLRAMERAEGRGFIECGVSLRSGWITDEGLKLIRSIEDVKQGKGA